VGKDIKRGGRGRKMEKLILKWELIGIALIIILGGALHFVFELSGGWRPLAVIAAVNESVWEHLKLGFWPALIYFIVEYFYIRKYSKNFFFAKAIGILVIPVSIIVLFYAYTAFTEDSLAIDLTIFVAAVVIGQSTSYWLLKVESLPSWANGVGIALLVLMTAAFSTLTYHALEWPIFQDPAGGGYGIP
jgi:hypothetical protein